MSWLAFIASLVRSLAWPAGVVVAVLRRPIGVALGRGIRRLRAGPIEVEFDQELAEVRKDLLRSPELAAAEVSAQATFTEDLAKLAEVSPRAAVLQAFARIEAGLRDLIDGSSVSTVGLYDLESLTWAARSQGLISKETVEGMQGLSALRDLAVNSPDEKIGVKRAREYVALTEAVLIALRAKPGS